jgi:hypothetical protein
MVPEGKETSSSERLNCVGYSVGLWRVLLCKLLI